MQREGSTYARTTYSQSLKTETAVYTKLYTIRTFDRIHIVIQFLPRAGEQEKAPAGSHSRAHIIIPYRVPPLRDITRMIYKYTRALYVLPLRIYARPYIYIPHLSLKLIIRSRRWRRVIKSPLNGNYKCFIAAAHRVRYYYSTTTPVYSLLPPLDNRFLSAHTRTHRDLCTCAQVKFRADVRPFCRARVRGGKFMVRAGRRGKGNARK